MHASRRYSSLGFLLAAAALAFAGCDGVSNSHSDAGTVTVGPGGSAAGGAHGSSGTGGVAAGGAGHASSGRSGNDAGLTDGSTGPSDASYSNGDASDAAPGCGCVQQTISWYQKSSTMEGPHSTLSSCALFTAGSPPDNDAQVSCTIDLASCDGGTNAGLIQEAIAFPGVHAALALAPVVFGSAPNAGAVFRIDIGGKFIDIGGTCPATATGCLATPTDVLVFKQLLIDFRNEQLRKSPCKELFTHNDESCADRKMQSNRVLMVTQSALHHACASVDDCTLFVPSTDCAARCEEVVSRSEAQQLKDMIANLNTQFCVDYEQDCGPVFIPPCTPPGALACVNNQCVMQ